MLTDHATAQPLVAVVRPTANELAALFTTAAAVIGSNGLNKRYLYDTKQAQTGLPLEKCRVDIIGALNVAAHDTPRYGRSPLVYAAEQVLEKRIAPVSLVTWNDAKGRDKDDAVVLLLSAAADLQTEAAS
ncbi:hypothetical protein [Streptomyces sp. NPDC058254]|uniref:DUF6197 family protein n=1 Tax=Streptomyces sp. NPDC058254 TaxID=3346406 RepID=UPI0036E64E72